MGKKDRGYSMVEYVNGSLVYHETNRGERFLDFSTCGYEGGGVPLPIASVKMVLESFKVNITDPDSVIIDDTERIQAAIDACGVDKVNSDGDISAILLKAGTYFIAGTLKMTQSGVVLRGEGQDRTIVICTGAVQRSMIVASGGGPGPLYKKDGSFPILTTGDQKVCLGTTTIPVLHAGNIQVGDTVYIERTPNVSMLYGPITLFFVASLERDWSLHMHTALTQLVIPSNLLSFCSCAFLYTLVCTDGMDKMHRHGQVGRWSQKGRLQLES